MRRVADYDPEDLLCPVDPGGRERGISDDVAFAGPFGGDVLHPLLAPGGEPCRQDQAQVATAEGPLGYSCFGCSAAWRIPGL